MEKIGAKRLTNAMISIAICALLASCGSVRNLLGLNSGGSPAEEASAAGCILAGLEKSGDVPSAERRELPVDEAIAEIERYQPADGTAAGGLGQLKEALIAQLRSSGAEKVSSAPPAGERNEIWDVALVGSGDEGWQLQWPYTNAGDYDQNGEVGVSDLTPVGVHFGKTEADDGWLAAMLADGDDNGEVGVSDITPIGQNFMAQVGGYNAYGADDPDGPWTLVGSGALPALPKDMPVRLFLDLPGNDYEFYHVRPYDYSEAEGEPSWLTTTAAQPAEVQLGEDTELVSLVIGPDGGTIEGPSASPIEGVRVEFPPGALAEDVEVSLGYNDGQVVFGGEADGLILVLEAGDVYEFAKPAKITVPFDGDEDSIPLMFDVEDDGGLEGLQLAELDYGSGEAVFDTFHASPKYYELAMNLHWDPRTPRLPPEFYLLKDAFKVKNTRSAYSSGNCFGMVVFAKWYFDEEMYKTDGNLQKSFLNFFSDGDPYTKDPLGQDVIATRAQISVNRYWKDYGIKIVAKGYSSSDKYNFNALYQMMAISGRPQVLELRNSVDDNFDGDTGSHAVLVYYLVWNTGVDRAYVFIYDPNRPEAAEVIEYTLSTHKFSPLELSCGKFDKVIHLGTGTIRYAESFYDILVDARQNFAGSANATIDVLSHESGAHVQDRSIDLYGKVHSGEVLVERLGIANGDFRVEYDIDTNGEFNAAIPIFKGTNTILFNTMGFDEDNRLRVLQHNLITAPFIIEGDFDGTAMLVELSWDYAEQMACAMYLRNTATDEYMCYATDYMYSYGGGEFWHNPTVDPTGYGPEYVQWEFTDSVFDASAYPNGQDWGVYVKCFLFNPTLGLDQLQYRVILIQDEGTSTEKRQVINGFFTDTTDPYPQFAVPPWHYVEGFHLGAP